MADTQPSGQVETPADFGMGPRGRVSYWVAEIKAYEKSFNNWTLRCRKIEQRYRDNPSDGVESQNPRPTSRRLNVLWSNVQTLQPALYLRSPKVQVSRRFQDRDPVGREAAKILERSVEFSKDTDEFDDYLRGSRDDYLLAGRGIMWQRYCPTFGEAKADKIQVTKQGAIGDLIGKDVQPTYLGPDGALIEPERVKLDDIGSAYIDGEPYQPLLFEEVRSDYVNWNQFGHTVAPRWEKVSAVWKWELLTRDELVARFGQEVGGKVPLTAKVEHVADDEVKAHGDLFKRAKVYEIWDKVSRNVLWICQDYKDGPLDVRKDPLKLQGFYPCPKPLYATLTTNNLIPVPDYAEYQDQAQEIDDITARISVLTRALKVAGVYNGQFPEMQRLLDSGAENLLIPVTEWNSFPERNGLDGAISFLPIKEIISTIVQLYNCRAQVKQDLYEVTGLSDILRGNSDPRETATAQKIKGNFGTLRLQDRQQEVARFARDCLRIKAEIIAEHFSPETLRQISGSELPSAMDKKLAAAQYQLVAQQAQATGQQPPPPPDILQTPSFEDVMQLLRDDKMRTFRLDVETNSTLAADQEEEKQSRVEFVTAIGGFLDRAVSAAERFPDMVPILGEILMFAIRGFPVGRDLEQKFEESLRALEAKVQAGGGGAGGPQGAAQAKQAAEAQTAMARAQADQAIIQARAQADQAQAQRDAMAAQQDAQIKALEYQMKQATLQQQMERDAMEHQNTMTELQAKQRLINTQDRADTMRTMRDSVLEHDTDVPPAGGTFR